MTIDERVIFALLMPAWIVVRAIIMVLKWKNKQEVSIKREVVLGVMFIYLLCAFALTCLPLAFTRFNGNVSINLVPVYSTINDVIKTTSNSNTSSYMVNFWIINIGGNILLLLPLGVFLPLLWRRFQKLKTTVLCAFCFSLFIEAFQLLSSFMGVLDRAFDVDDLLLNTLGAFLGFIVFDKIISKIGFVMEV